MKTATTHLTFNTPQRRELIRITEEVQATVGEAGIAPRRLGVTEEQEPRHLESVPSPLPTLYPESGVGDTSSRARRGRKEKRARVRTAGASSDILAASGYGSWQRWYCWS